MEPTQVAYPVRFSIEPADQVARWRPFVNWLLAIPHWILVEVLQTVAQACAFICWFWILFTGSAPNGLLGVIAMYQREWMRATTYALFLYEDYPPFEFTPEPEDSGRFSRTSLSIDVPTGERDRLTVFFRLVLLIPHALALLVLGLAMFFVVGIGALAVLFTGSWPVGLRDFTIGYLRWVARVQAYGYLLTDEFPPFRLD